MCGLTHLFPVVQALIVILHDGDALILAVGVVFGAVGHIAGQQLLPEGKAAGRAWDVSVMMKEMEGQAGGCAVALRAMGFAGAVSRTYLRSSRIRTPWWAMQRPGVWAQAAQEGVLTLGCRRRRCG